ncbi:MAG: bifunctional YncE family protein/alkaline phosphatase family protein [Phycisphaerales bacterium]|nr:bifunctional YncE family protein/alkaline phosphatase family protein [Phycisphaerales bacterium]
MRRAIIVLVVVAAWLVRSAGGQPEVGPDGAGGVVVPTAQLIRAAGESLEVAGRPVEIVATPDGRFALAKDNRGLILIDLAAWSVVQELAIPGKGGSMTGLAVSPDGRRVVVTDAGSFAHVAEFSERGTLAWSARIELPEASVGGAAYPCGVAFLPDSSRVAVCLSRANTVAVLSLADGRVEREIPVGVAPFGVVVSADGRRAWVTNRGGRRPGAEDRTAPSAGTPTVIDERGIAATGTVSVLDLESGRELEQIGVGLSPGGLALSPDGSRLYVANSNSDQLSAIDTASGEVVATVLVRPDEALPFGSMPSSVAVSPDGARVYVACAGNNALAVLDAPRGLAIAGWIPTGWYPGSVAVSGDALLIANIKGVGSRTPAGGAPGRYNSLRHRGTLQKIAVPAGPELGALTSRALADARVPETLRSLEHASGAGGAAPVPSRVGAPSVFEHVVYVIKENRTFDQVFGDMPGANAEPGLCIYGREVTPNQHAMAEQFVLLDNYYCSGVLSADGHSWATEGNVTPYLERSFGGFVRSYTFGDDPLTYSSSGFVWDHVLAAGLSFRNYGEFDYAGIQPRGDYFSVYEDWRSGAGVHTFPQSIGVENLRRYSCPTYPGWNLDIPDVLRADRFLAELASFERGEGALPNFVLVYLPNDHTAGTGRGHPTPRAQVADNDLALGRIVEGLSRSRFWARTCIFVIEDDPQDGFDHVDGHRSTCQVVSPYSRLGSVVSEFYNQGSVVHTMERILGIAPANQLYAMSPLMSACFGETPDVTPFEALPNTVPLDEANPSAAVLTGEARRLAEASERIDFSVFDAADEDTLNRILWHASRGEEPYPAAWAGAHGRGLAALGLRLAEPGERGPGVTDFDDDDD